MSVFDLFRGFFGVPGGLYPNRRDPFFEAMTRDDDDDGGDEDGDEDEGGRFFHRDQRGPSDPSWRFGFSAGPDAMRFHGPPEFGRLLREMEDVFSQFGHPGVPALLPPHRDRSEGAQQGSSGNPLRDSMLKAPDGDPQQPRRPPAEPRRDARPSEKSPASPRGWSSFSQFDVWKKRPAEFPEEERRVDGDLDSAVSSGGLDQIMAPPGDRTPQQPRSRSFFQSVTVTKVLRPDGSVEERRTVRDGRGHEETTVSVSGDQEQPRSDAPDDPALFSRLFGRLK